MSALDHAPLVEPSDRDGWRAWLAAHHDTDSGAWLVTPRRAADRGDLSYDAAVEEALCFGWVDGQQQVVDEQRSKQYFAPRRRGSPWAATNKARIERLLAEGLMAPAGLAVIERARVDGSWTVFDSVERLEVPDDLAAALDARSPARTEFDAFPSSARKQLLAWIALARRPETRATRVAAVAESAARGERANNV